MYKKLVLFSVFCWLASGVSAQAFWIAPQKWTVEVNKPVQFRLWLGENFTGKPWEGTVSRITRFVSVLDKSETDRLWQLREYGLKVLFIPFDKPGTHLIALQTDRKLVELDAISFEEHLKTEGFDRIVEQRKKAGLSDRSARENYRREAATLLQVGDKPTAVDFGKSGFDLKIIPLVNPLKADTLKETGFQILYKSKPLTGVRVRHFVKLEDGKVIEQKKVTDAKGRVRFRLDKGEHLINLVYIEPHKGSDEVDWESDWASLTFKVE